MDLHKIIDDLAPKQKEKEISRVLQRGSNAIVLSYWHVVWIVVDSNAVHFGKSLVVLYEPHFHCKYYVLHAF